MNVEVVVDTNVLHVANGTAEHADHKCFLACTEELDRLQNTAVPILDTAGEILREYRRVRIEQSQRRPGDAFVKWISRNLGNEEVVRQVTITPHPERGYEEFPSDASVTGFDPDDRKFVAVAVASGSNPAIVNATDTDWWEFRDAFHELGIAVRFICEHLVSRSS